MGVSVNSTAYSAKLMTAMAFDPKLIGPMLFGDTENTHAYVQDGSALARPQERLSWWQLMVRSFTPFAGYRAHGGLYRSDACNVDALMLVKDEGKTDQFLGRISRYGLYTDGSTSASPQLLPVPLAALSRFHRWTAVYPMVWHLCASEACLLLLQGRARTVGQVLLGWYEIPSQMGQPVDIIVNPAGIEERSRLRY